MTFAVHTFETNPEGKLGFAYHEDINEGQQVYFLAKFPHGTAKAETIAEDLFGAVVDDLRSSRLSQMYDRFEEALKAANSVFKKYQSDLNELPEIVIGFFNFNELYLTQAGKSEAYLLREQNLSQITESVTSSSDLFVNILSGQVAVNDIVIFTSDRLLRFVTANQLSDLFAQPDYNGAIAKFKHEIAEKSDTDLVITIIGVGKKDSSTASGFVSKVVSKSSALASSLKPELVPRESDNPSSTTESPSVEPNPPAPSDTQGHTSPIAKIKSKTSFEKLALPKIKIPRNFIILSLAAILTIVIVMSLSSLGGESEEELYLREQFQISQEGINEAQKFILQGDKEQAKVQIDKAKEAVENIFGSKTTLYRKQAQIQLARIKQARLDLENATSVTPVELAMLDGTNDNVNAIGMDRLGGNLLVYTPKSVIKAVRSVVDRAVPLNESGGSESIVAGSVNADQKTLIMLSDSPRIIEYREGIINTMQTEDEAWENGIDVKTYGARFIYILDPTDNQIWKYSRNSANYSGKTAYNNGGNLANAVSFAIDGSIFVLSDDGAIQKYDRGNLVPYDFRNLPSDPITGANLRIYTKRDLDFIYILDPDEERVLVFEKGASAATYKRQIYYNIADVTDFAVVENGQKISLLTKTKIFEFNL